MQKLPPENLLQYIWLGKYLLTHSLSTHCGKEVKVLKTGLLNLHQGPDFYDARLIIDGTTWAGNLEVHVKSSDWRKHKHQLDAAYQNIILHVVYLHDEEVYDILGNHIPCLELMPYIPEQLLENYDTLMKSKSKVPCQNIFIPPAQELVTIFKERLIIEKLKLKLESIEERLVANKYHWEELLIQLLFQYAGMGLNNLPMEQLIRRVPWSLIQKYRDEPPTLISLFAGVSGLGFEHFEQASESKFDELNGLLQLNIMDKSIWKHKGNRPASFPEKRISQVIDLICKEKQLLKKTIELKDLDTVKNLFGYKKSAFYDGLLINVIIPLKFAYGKIEGKFGQEEIAIQLLESLEAEEISVIKIFKEMGILIENAKDSQAFLHLKKHYCESKRCLQCTFTESLFKKDNY